MTHRFHPPAFPMNRRREVPAAALLLAVCCLLPPAATAEDAVALSTYKASYRTLVADLYFVYSAMEEEFSRLRNHPVVGPVAFPELNRRETLEQDFTIYEKRGEEWIDCGLDQAVKDVNFAEFKRLGLLIKKIMDADQWLA